MIGTLEERFWAKVDAREPDQCWPFVGCLNSSGYGSIGLDGKVLGAHRISWMLHYGPIPKGMLVCHSCDNPACVNPSHLWLGTNADNMADKARKGRVIAPSWRGEDVPTAKLTSADVMTIRRLHSTGLSNRAIAHRYDVCHGCIDKIIHRTTWTHIP